MRVFWPPPVKAQPLQWSHVDLKWVDFDATVQRHYIIRSLPDSGIQCWNGKCEYLRFFSELFIREKV